VSKGETLYAIAWAYELDVARLAAVNGIPQPYLIKPGQRLDLDTSKAPVEVTAPAAAAAPGSKARTSGTGTVVTSRSTGAVSGAAAQPKSRPATSSRTTSPVVPAKQPAALPTGDLSWQWPVKGQITREYDSSRVFKGINIQSTPGRVVKSAADGIVVYAGDGLRGYGLLIIVKHSETYLSAYAHNRKIFVREGAAVGKGEKIAEVGGDPQNRGRLYFELRRNGRPIDPTRLLPRQ